MKTQQGPSSTSGAITNRAASHDLMNGTLKQPDPTVMFSFNPALRLVASVALSIDCSRSRADSEMEFTQHEIET